MDGKSFNGMHPIQSLPKELNNSPPCSCSNILLSKSHHHSCYYLKVCIPDLNKIRTNRPYTVQKPLQLCILYIGIDQTQTCHELVMQER